VGVRHLTPWRSTRSAGKPGPLAASPRSGPKLEALTNREPAITLVQMSWRKRTPWAAAATLLAAGWASGCSSGHRAQPATMPTSTAQVAPVPTTRQPPVRLPETVVPTTSVPATVVPTTSVPATVGCANDTVSNPLTTALVAANGTPGGQALPGSIYYGTCGTTAYAVARFGPAPGATMQEQIAFQDAGSVAHYFVRPAEGLWTLAGTAPFPSATSSCATFTQLPAALRAIWRDCPQG
jgi:hypothetical protein